MAKQFRQPSGPAGSRIGIIMNNGNEILYDFTASAMQLQPDERILEIGFGNGKFFNKLFSKANNLHISGIDFSDIMLKEAREKNQAAIANGKLQLEFGNSEELPFADNSFDKVFCINVVYFWDDPLKHLQEINRVLKPGGQFYATIRSKSTMEMLPFIQYGFITYSEEDWKSVIHKTPLRFVKSERINEPTIEYDDKPFQMYSLCLVAEKK